MRRAFLIVGGALAGFMFFSNFGIPLTEFVAEGSLQTFDGNVLPLSFKYSNLPLAISVIRYCFLPAILAGFLANMIAQTGIWISAFALFGFSILYAIIDTLYLSTYNWLPGGGQFFYRFGLDFSQFLLWLALISGGIIGGYLSFELRDKQLGLNVFLFIFLLLVLNISFLILSLIAPLVKSEAVGMALTFTPYAIAGIVGPLFSTRYGVLMSFLSCIAYRFQLFGSSMTVNVAVGYSPTIYRDIQIDWLLHTLVMCLVILAFAFLTQALSRRFEAGGLFKSLTIASLSMLVIWACIPFIRGRAREKPPLILGIETFVIPEDYLTLNGELKWVAISPNGQRIALCYRLGKDNHIRILSRIGKPLDFPIPPQLDISSSPGIWSPDSEKLLLQSTSEESSQPWEGLVLARWDVLLLNISNGSIHKFSNCDLSGVSIYSPWNKESNAFITTERIPPPYRLSLWLCDIEGKKVKRLFVYKFEKADRLPLAGASWDRESGDIYAWEEERGFFRVHYPDAKVDKLNDFPSQKEQYTFSLLLTGGSKRLLLGREEIREEVSHRSCLAILDLEKQRYTHKHIFEDSFSRFTTPFLSLYHIRVSPSGKAILLFTPISSIPPRVLYFEPNGKVKSSILRLPPGSIADALWGEDDSVIYVALIDFDPSSPSPKVIKLLKLPSGLKKSDLKGGNLGGGG